MAFYRLKITDIETGEIRQSFQKWKTEKEAEKTKNIFEDLIGIRHKHLKKKKFEIVKVKN